jgi:integrase
MGLYKLCCHRGRARDRCEHAWWGSFQHKGQLHRASLAKWAASDVRSKAEAEALLDRMRQAIRSGSFDNSRAVQADAALTFKAFAAIYVERYVQANALASADTIEYRMAPLLRHFGGKLLRDIRTADIEDFIADLRLPSPLASHHKTTRVRRPATINRYLSLLKHMFNWAVGREYLERTPFRQGTQNLIPMEQEDNRRHRRLSPEEEARLLEAAAGLLKPLIIAALDTGMRRGEMLALTWADVDARPGWLRLRGATTKSGRTRWVPVSTTRLEAVLGFLRLDAAGGQKPADGWVFSNEVGAPIRYFKRPWLAACRVAHVTDLRWHDLRHEYASRLVEHGVPLSQVRDLLGHASIVTTERYDNQKPEALMAAAKRLETGATFKNVSTLDAMPDADTPVDEPFGDAKSLSGLEEGVGVSDGVRTRDFRSHSPALYH